MEQFGIFVSRVDRQLRKEDSERRYHGYSQTAANCVTRLECTDVLSLETPYSVETQNM